MSSEQDIRKILKKNGPQHTKTAYTGSLDSLLKKNRQNYGGARTYKGPIYSSYLPGAMVSTYLNQKSKGGIIHSRFARFAAAGLAVLIGAKLVSGCMNSHDSLPDDDYFKRQPSIQKYENKAVDPRINKLEKPAVDDIIQDTDKQLDKQPAKYVPDEPNLEDIFRRSESSKEYQISIGDSSVSSPYVLSADMIKKAAYLTKDAKSEQEKAKAIFDWMDNNINYDYEKRDMINTSKPHKLSDSISTLKNSKGVCCEQAFLYIAMARSVGLDASYASVDVDYKGEKVNHACAAVKIDDKTVLVDPAYHSFDAKHQKFTVENDKTLSDRYYSRFE